MNGDSLFSRDSLGITRSGSTNSVLSVQSEENMENSEDFNDNGSVDLLAEDRLARTRDGAAGQETQLMETGVINEEQLRRAIKRAMEPLMNEVKKIKTQNHALDKKVTQVVAQNETLQKQVKEFKAEMSKGCDNLNILLTGEGLKFLKEICLGNLDMVAKEPEELALLQRFMDKATQENWLLKRSQKSETDITSRFRDNRNYLKAQIRLRVAEDLTNQTPQTSAKLLKTTKFIREHLATPELSNEQLLVLYNYAYTVLKYNNKGFDEATMTEDDKKIKKKAQKNIWVYSMERTTKDLNAQKQASQIQDKISRLLTTGLKYIPC